GGWLAFLAERTERAMKYDSAILQRQPPLDVPEGVGSHLMRIQWSTVVAGYGASCASLFYAAPRRARRASCVSSSSWRREKSIRDGNRRAPFVSTSE
ncbi:hypothetical protein ALC56_10450, partial [Trachymyrmex septentrionalis]